LRADAQRMAAVAAGCLHLHRNAFTLIELLIVVIVLGILMTVLLPNFLGSSASAQDSAARQYLTVSYRAAKNVQAERNGTSLPAAALIDALRVSEPELSYTAAVEDAGQRTVAVAADGEQGLVLTIVSASGKTCTLTSVAAANYAPVFACAPSALAAGQTIDFAPLADRPISSGDFDPGATTSSGLAVSYGVTVDGGHCAIVDGKVHLLAAGICTVEANQEGDNDFEAALPVSRSFLITAPPPVQTIAFAPLPDRTLGGADFDPGAVSSSGLAVGYTITSGGGHCALVSGKVHLVDAGTCTVEADQDGGNGSFAPAAPITRSFTISAAPTGYSAAVSVTPGLIAYWRLDETSGESAADSAGGHPGSYTNSPALGLTGATPSDTLNNAIMVSGNSPQSVDVPYAAALNPASFSIELWAKFAFSTSTQNQEQALATTLDGSGGFQLSKEGSNDPHNDHNSYPVVFTLRGSEGLRSVQTPGAHGNVSYGPWHLLDATYSASGAGTLSLYVDGVYQGSSAGAYSASSGGLQFGRNHPHLSGSLDNISLYSGALSAATIATHYAAR